MIPALNPDHNCGHNLSILEGREWEPRALSKFRQVTEKYLCVILGIILLILMAHKPPPVLSRGFH